ncbi:FAD-dependent oxidoreductase [Quisquiliibacterium transsilvanicum]|uniref:NADPH-dependent 2,4-dienoyl-CoA reductase/sulfur reductase-like enzyme n=1 Tax=Quisquiliibacterium transsilvanicum TaxID=1549638 RepID=A0A7W8HJ26_9BURK|nr:FAD-dependent oxidoreductase [Quisquiliibacterium transsilvanicum]MBB5272868.1 NADPH-dependent 2,4-dienoyl-CoA reductase/sulfur reductase-like enzyme [Quisquiliibacterium transsilvanicum]
MPKRLVIIGADAAGMSAAAQVRRLAKPDEFDILAFERGRHTSYAACGLPYLVGGFVEGPERLVARSPEEHRARGIDVRIRHEVLAIDPKARTVTVRDLESGAERAERYDELLIATGASGVMPPWPGADAKGVLQLRTLDDAAELQRLIDGGARRAVVVGAGYIGLEVAEALVERGLEVTVVERLDAPMGSVLDADMAGAVAEAMRSAGVDLRLGSSVEGFDTKDGRVSAVRTDGGAIAADVVVVGLGVRANSGLAREAGISVGEAGGILVDDHMRTGTPHVWAAGDCVESRHRVSGASMVVALGTHANKQGRAAGTNIAGGDDSFGGVLGTAVTRFGSLEIGVTGLTERDAAKAGFDAVGVVTESLTRAHYYPGAQPIRIKVLAERASGRLLGAQIVGGEAAGKRIDVLATALWNGMTVDEIGGMDLSYAPPFSPVWDPVLLAAGKAAAAL